ncbi:MAG TPA: Hint domain-containing protein [Acetobacteraceae bacterium]|nr:Hint domain-containing protein [Acetobacteraceae bacterium]
MSGTFTYQGAVIQTETITTSGTYDIVAYGAQGGNGGDTTGGLGAEVGGDFVLTAGEVIEVVVGGAGASGVAGGGGGGTFVRETFNGTNPVHIPLVIAGGGGGGGYGASNGGDGSINTSGDAGIGTGGGAGGSGGSGGAGGGKAGGGGGGYIGGTGGARGGYATSGSGSIGATYTGGAGYSGNGAGGFGGGGGGGFNGGGGGGGYSGGGGGGGANGSFSGAGAGGGGGGGSFDGGTDQVLVAGENAGNGMVTITMVCFLRGTRIATQDGETAVEALAIGDMVATEVSGATVFKPIKWIGWRRVDPRAHPNREAIAPVLIQRGAFADNVPHRDLLVSPDHAILADGKLICARQLINGTTIRQAKTLAAIEYFHIELETHAILLAEGLPTESYLDTGNRGFFANADEPFALHPDLTSQPDHPTREAASCMPFVWDENSVRPVWDRLARRAASLGLPPPSTRTTADAELCIIAQGATLRPIDHRNGRYHFVLPNGAHELRVVSRAASPTDARPWIDDRRRLGMCVTRILLRGDSDTMQDIPLDHPALTRGWWMVERGNQGMCRWTDGDAEIRLTVNGGSMLEIHATTAGMAYPLTDRRAA